MKKMNKDKKIAAFYFLIFSLVLIHVSCQKNEEAKNKYPCSEIMQILSMGFNAADDTYYFYGYEDYSEAIMDPDASLSTGTAGVFYPRGRDIGRPPRKYIRYNGQNNSIGYYYCHRWPDLVDSDAYEYKFKNGRLVHWATYRIGYNGDFIPCNTLVKIEQDTQGIRIYYQDRGKGAVKNFSYYNISRTELLDIFLKKYVQLICDINNRIENNNTDEILLDFIRVRTPQELAIFRNCLYAIKGSKFADSTWEEFFNKYLEGYEAEYSDNEVTAMFNESEEWLLHLILRYENRRN
jgi:hypothetical protein